ncbi:MAG: acyl-CoA/acyl-ACP dehydrogenase, partial [Acidimicrobiia bacterium]|nr:acyl-CoA/acyl-ACP dehydrogenase [Acidimicrobiia bacterium]
MQSRSIDVGFMPEAETLLARAEKFRTTTLESGAFTWEYMDRGPNVAALREAARLGMTGIEVDRNLGGLGFGFREKVRVAEILSRSSIGFAFSLINTQNVAARLARLGGERHRDAYLPDLLAGRRFGATALTEPEVGSDFAAITTSATRTDSGWVLNGRKAWITNAVIADVFLCYAQTDPELGRDGIACFVVDGRREGFETADGYQLVAGSTVGVGGFTLDGYEAVEDDLIIEPGAGFRQALLGVNGARIYVAAMACAAVRAALGQAVEYALTRESFGQPILAHQGLAWSLAAVANRLEAAEALTARAVDRHEDAQAGAEGDQSHDDAQSEVVRLSALAAAHAKKFTTEMIEPALETCMQAMGAEGLRAGQAAGRLLSESRILSYVDGTTEMQTERIALSLDRFYGAGSSDLVSVAISTASGRPEAASDLADLDESPSPDETPSSDTVGGESEPVQFEETDETGLLGASEWSTGTFSPAPQSEGLFADAPMADATRTIEFE